MTDLNHPRVKPLTQIIAKELGFNPRFIEFLFAESLPECFDFRIESTEYSWTCFVPDEVEAAYPLWSTNGDETLVCRGQGRRWFLSAYHDDPETHYISETVQGLLAYLFMTMYESESTVDELRTAAEVCGFRHLDEVIEFEDKHADDFENWEQEQQQFIHQIDTFSKKGQA